MNNFLEYIIYQIGLEDDWKIYLTVETNEGFSTNGK